VRLEEEVVVEVAVEVAVEVVEGAMEAGHMVVGHRDQAQVAVDLQLEGALEGATVHPFMVLECMDIILMEAICWLWEHLGMTVIMVIIMMVHTLMELMVEAGLPPLF